MEYNNVFDALEDDSGIAKNLFIRGQLMMVISEYIKTNKLTQKAAGLKMDVMQSRISDLVRGKIDRFTVDMLISMLEKIEIDVDFIVKEAA